MAFALLAKVILETQVSGRLIADLPANSLPAFLYLDKGPIAPNTTTAGLLFSALSEFLGRPQTAPGPSEALVSGDYNNRM